MVIQSFPPVLGGAQRQVERLAPHLERRGVEVSVVTRRPPGTAAWERNAGYTLYRIGVPPFAAGASIAYTARGTAVVVRLRPDVVHVHDLLSPGSIGIAAGLLTRAPVVAKVLTAGPGGDLERLIAKPLGGPRLLVMARRFATFICLSEEIERELTRYGVPPERMTRIPNGVDTNRFRPPRAGEREAARRELGMPREDFLAVYCGRFTPSKRLDVLVEAFHGVPGRLLLVGAGPEDERLRMLASDPALEGRVLLKATVDDPAPIHRAADVYASASRAEGMSGSVLEAMATGLPVVASPASGMSELIGANRAGVLLEDERPSSLRRALVEMASDPDRRSAIGAEGRRVVLRDYSLETMADRLLGLYESVSARSRSAFGSGAPS